MTTETTPLSVTENENGQEAKPTPEGTEGVQAAKETDTPATSETQEAKKEEDEKVSAAIQARIDEITAKRRNAERDAEYWKQRAMTAAPTVGAQAAPEPAKPDVDPNAPKLEEFQDYGEWVRATTQYEINKTVRRMDSQKKGHETRQSFHQAVAEFKKTNPDFEEVAFNESVPINEPMVAAIVGSAKGPQVAYFLGKNPDEAARIARLDPLSAAREIGKLEEKLAGPPPKNVTQAPKPLKPVSQTGGDAVKIDLDKADMDSYAAARADSFAWRKPKKK